MDDSLKERSASFGSVETMVLEGAFIDRGDDDAAPHLFLPQRAWHEHSHDEGRRRLWSPTSRQLPNLGHRPTPPAMSVEDAADPSERRHEFTQHEMMITRASSGVLMHPHSDALEAEMEEAVTWGSHEDADAEEEDPSRNPLSALRHGADPRRSTRASGGGGSAHNGKRCRQHL